MTKTLIFYSIIEQKDFLLNFQNQLLYYLYFLHQTLKKKFSKKNILNIQFYKLSLILFK